MLKLALLSVCILLSCWGAHSVPLDSRFAALRSATVTGDPANIQLTADFVLAQLAGVTKEEMVSGMKKLLKLLRLDGSEFETVIIDSVTPTSLTDMVSKSATCAKASPYFSAGITAVKNANGHAYINAKPAAEVKAIVIDVACYGYILEKINIESRKDTEFLRRFYVLTKGQAKGFKNNFNLFMKAKFFSVILAVDGLLNQMDNKKGSGIIQSVALLSANILEAVLEDTRLGFSKNAKAGWVLAKSTQTKTPNPKTGSGPNVISADGKAVERGLPLMPKWDDLYLTWNFAFVSHFESAPYYWAKLIIPSVICYQEKPREFLFPRVIALWTHLLFCSYTQGFDNNQWGKVTGWNNDNFINAFSQANLISANAYEAALKQADPSALNELSTAVTEFFEKGMDKGQDALARLEKALEEGGARWVDSFKSAVENVGQKVTNAGRSVSNAFKSFFD